MLDMGFIVDVETILSRCPRERQTALFSATMPYAILRICDRFMKRDPAHVTVRPDLRTVETVRQLVYFVAEQDKVRGAGRAQRALRLRPAARLPAHPDRRRPPGSHPEAPRARTSPPCTAASRQRERDRTLAAFKAGKIQFLIATNVASRGLDITDLPYVLSLRHPRGRGHVRPSHRPHRARRQGGHRHHLRGRVGPRRLGGDPQRGRRQGRGGPALPLRPRA